MARKIIVNVQKGGTFQAETEGFNDAESCRTTANELMQCINGASVTAEEDRDYDGDDVSQFLNV